MKVENIEIKEEEKEFRSSCCSSSQVVVKSSQIDYQNCPICLCPFDSDALACLDACSHKFCFDCIQEWSKKINTCPIDRKKYTYIEVRTKKGLLKRIKVEDRTNVDQEEGPNDLTYCEVCHLSNREDRMLLCDGCDRGFHCECLIPAIEDIPIGDWYCPRCVAIRASVNESFHVLSHSDLEPTTSQIASQQHSQQRLIARTNYAERVRRNVNQRRKTTTKRRRVVKRRRTKKKRKTTVKRRRRVTKTTKTTTKMTASRLTSIKKVRTYRRRRKTTKKRKVTGGKTLKFNSIKLKRHVLNRPKERIIKKIIRKSDEKKVFDLRVAGETALVNNVTSDLMSDYVFRDLPCTSRDLDNDFEYKPKIINQQQPKISTSTSSNIFDSILSDIKLLHKKSEEIQVKTDGSLNLMNRTKSLFKTTNNTSNDHSTDSHIKRIKREDSSNEASIEVKNEQLTHDLRSYHSETTTKILQPKTKPTSSSMMNEPIVKRECIVKEEKLPPVNGSKKHEEMKSQVNSNEKRTYLTYKSKSMSDANKRVKISFYSEENPMGSKKIRVEENNIKEEKKENHVKEDGKYDHVKPTTSNKANELSNIIDTAVKIEKVEPTTSNDNDKLVMKESTNISRDRIIEIAKTTLKPYYVKQLINKDTYKYIMKRVVEKTLDQIEHGSSSICVEKIAKLVKQYAERFGTQSKK